MPKYQRKYDTPTDAVSRKVFDREKDRQVRRHVELKKEVQELRRTVKQILQWKADLFLMGKALPPPPERKL